MSKSNTVGMFAAILLCFFVLFPFGVTANSIQIKTSGDWFSGTGLYVDEYSLYGSLQLLPSNQLHNDSFDQDFLKFIWTKDTVSFVSLAGNNINL